MEDLKQLKVKNWKETAKGRRTWKDLAKKAKPHKGLQCQMMTTIILHRQRKWEKGFTLLEDVQQKDSSLLGCYVGAL